MRQSSGLAWVLCALLCLWGAATGQTTQATETIDVLRPVVRRSPVQTADDDFFGYTVVLHQLAATPGDFEEALNQTRIIVGAPRGTFPGGLTSLSVSAFPNASPENLTGLIYDCPVRQGDCGGLLGNGEGDDLRLFDPEPDAADNDTGDDIEQKSEQFLGGTMYSSGDYFLVCAHRWASIRVGVNVVDNRRTYGRCFVSNRDLTNFDLVQPCESSTLSNQRIGDVHCSAGVGAALYEDSAGPGLVLGAPGFEVAIGQLYFYGLAPNGSAGSSMQTNPPLGAPGVDYSYLGYTVTTGRIRSAGSLDLLASRPRFNRETYMGQVQLLSFDDITDLSLQNVNGNQTGEYFGFSLATADLNNDGFDELLVGAPMYSNPGEPSLGRPAVPEIGRVYVFENLNGMLSNTPIMLEGTDVAYSRFGHSIVNLGDINGDSYDDIAVGAPFMALENPDTNGTVFIYYGAGDDVITSSPQQIIRASDVVSAVEGLDELKTFGYSLASGVDVDANEYDDLAVGAISSQVVIVFRTHSLATLDVNFTSLVDTVDVETRNCNESMFACFNVSVCARYSGRGLSGELVLDLQVAEDRSVTSSNEQRLLFGSDPDEPYNQPFVFSEAGETNCDVITVYVKSTDVRELTPFTLDISFSSPPRPPQTINGNQILTDLTLTPLLVISGSTTVEVDLATRCGEDGICFSDLDLQMIEVIFVGANNAPLQNDGLVVDETIFVNVTLAYRNTAEDAFGTRIEFSLPEGILRHRRVDSAQSNIACTLVNATGGDYTCPLMSPLRVEDGFTTITLQWTVQQDLVGDEGTVDIPVRISIPPDSVMNSENATDLADNEFSISIPIVAEADVSVRASFSPSMVSYSGESLADPPTGLLPAASLGNQFNLVVRACNQGPSAIRNFQLEILLPLNGSNETQQLYYLYPFALTTEVAAPELGSITCDDSALNPDTRIRESPTGSRKRRFVRPEMVPHRREALNRVRRQDNANTRSCDLGFVDCVVIRCDITNPVVDAAFTVEIEGYVDERFYEGRTDTFAFVSTATVTVPASIGTERNDEDNTASSTLTVMPAPVVEDDTGKDVPWWVYFVSIFGALVIVIIIIICLYFFGFFRRKKHELEKKEAEGDFEVPAEMVGGVAGGAASGSVPGVVAGGVAGGGIADNEAMRYEEPEKELYEDEKKERFATPSPPPPADDKKEKSLGPGVEGLAMGEGGAETGGGAGAGGAATEVAVELEPGPANVEVETDFGYHGDIGGNDDFETEL